MTGAERLAAAGLSETFSLAQVRRVAAMLDLDPQQFVLGDAAPRGWHFALLAGETLRHELRSDGFPGLGVPMPQLGRSRLLLGQRSMAFHADLGIGAVVARQSAVVSILEKTGRNGPLSIVKVEHHLTQEGAGAPAVVEAQTYYLGGHPVGLSTKPEAVMPDLPMGSLSRVVTPDDIMLFQYSALGFNTHRIHFDRDYARQVEGHPDLVVNGGLATLLATEFLRTGLRLVPLTVTARHLAPLYVNRPMTILAQVEGGTARAVLFDSDGGVATDVALTLA